MDIKDRDVFRILLNLDKKQPWTSTRREALETLIYEECKSEDSRKLIIELIDRFHYLSSSDFNRCVKLLTEDIITDPDLEECNTQLVAMAADSTPDSSESILYALKPMLEDCGWREHHLVNKFGGAWHTYKLSPAHKKIVLVDEFVGSGSTVVNRYKEICRVFNNNGVHDFNIRVKVIVSTQKGYERVTQEGITIDYQYLINRGISDNYSGDLLLSMKSLMSQLEDLLLPRYKDRNLPRYGYGEVEALYTREEGNTPNSVFPIFWWPFYRNNSQRKTLLIRAMADA